MVTHGNKEGCRQKCRQRSNGYKWLQIIGLSQCRRFTGGREEGGKYKIVSITPLKMTAEHFFVQFQEIKTKNGLTAEMTAPVQDENVNLTPIKKQTPAESSPSSTIKGSRKQIHGGDAQWKDCGSARGLSGPLGSPARLQGHRQGSGAPIYRSAAGLLHRRGKVHGCGFGCVYLQDKSLIYYAVPSDCISSAGVSVSRMNPERITHPSGVPAEVAGKVHLPPPCPSAVSSPGARRLVGSDRPSVHPSDRSIPRPGPASPPSVWLYLYICLLPMRPRKGALCSRTRLKGVPLESSR
jgi:hypothetical protein